VSPQSGPVPIIVGCAETPEHEICKARPELMGVLNFELPNIQSWTFAGGLTAEGTISGFVSSAQGGVPVTFRRTSDGAG